jgi:hypothetical protein
MTNSTRRRLGVVLAWSGALIGVVGIAGLALGLGETTTTTNATASANASAGSSAAETPAEFLAKLQQAERAGDADFRLARLHPAVIDRYGDDACRVIASEPPDPTSTFAVVRIDHTGPWDYTTDGKTTTIADTVFVVVDRTAEGQTEQVTAHVATVDHQYRWFTDCTPA